VLAVLACLILAACGVTEPRPRVAAFPNDSAMARIERRGVLTVGIPFGQPLFGYKDPATGRITGFDAEIARMVAADITGSARNVQFVETVPRDREIFLERGVVDIVVATYSITKARRRVVEFTNPYYYAGQDTLVRAGDLTIRSVADLAGKKVCTETGTTSEDHLRSRSPKARLVIVHAIGECVPALVDGRLDAISTDNTILLGLMSQYPDVLRLVGNPFSRELYGIGLGKGDTVFRDYLDGLIKGYLSDGRWDRAFRETIGVVGVTAGPAKPQTAS
jgi:glutamate transport system substrate-binding protein